MKKRIIAAVMATLVGLSMVGCGSTSSDNSSQNKTDNTDSTAQAETSDGEKNPVTIRFYNYALSETAKADWCEKTSLIAWNLRLKMVSIVERGCGIEEESGEKNMSIGEKIN